MKTSRLMNFDDPEFGRIRTVCVNGAPWFVAADVCRALGLEQVSRAMSRLDDDEGGLLKVTHPQKVENMITVNAVNEAGLYHLILCSKKPEAKAFKRWITHEVIPSIRRYGGYVLDSVLDRLDEMPELIPEYLDRLREENANAKAQTERVLAENAKLLFKADYYDDFVSADDLTCLRYTAKELGVPQNRFIGYLLDNRYVFRDPHRDGRIFARAGKRSDPLFMTRDFYMRGHGKSEYTLVTPEGKAYFKEHAGEIAAWRPADAEGEKATEEAVFAEQQE